ncbi:MAG TPA: BNR-4 repeat-containing protein [Bryobacteraceae bacterium]|nr:BNR-4 repeat-containing protein [Bryobacteraceae bacterium]
MKCLLPFLLAVLPLVAAQAPITINDDGGWCWFEDERVLVVDGKLIAGSVASGYRDAGRKGAVEVAVYDPATGKRTVHTLHRPASDAERRLWLDDHNSPAFLVRPDGRILALYAQHGRQEKFYYRISKNARDATAWEDERVFVPSAISRVTYQNLHLLTAEKGRIYDFYRGYNNTNKPSWAWSDDSGETWKAGGVFIDVPSQFRHRPYVKYASNGSDTVHFAYTDGHPRDFDNSIYHMFYRGGKLHRSDGTVVRSLQEGLKAPEEGTRVFPGDPRNVAWISDLHLDQQGRPFLAFSVQKDSAGMAPGEGGEDFRYHQARWDGKAWSTREIAFGGSKLYPKEDDYTGNIALDPHDPNTVFISTNADPATGKPLTSKADGRRHWEIFRGSTRDGAKWTWTAVTKDSAEDNIRPVVPVWEGRQRAVLWLRGKMRSYTDYDFSVMALVGTR